MQPATVLVSVSTYEDGVRVAKIIRQSDETAEVQVHEARRGNGWTATAYICIPEEKIKELRDNIREFGAIHTMQRHGSKKPRKGSS